MARDRDLSKSQVSVAAEERAGVPASTVLERGELRTNTAPGGRMLDSLAGASKGLKGKGKKPPP